MILVRLFCGCEYGCGCGQREPESTRVKPPFGCCHRALQLVFLFTHAGVVFYLPVLLYFDCAHVVSVSVSDEQVFCKCFVDCRLKFL